MTILLFCSPFAPLCLGAQESNEPVKEVAEESVGFPESDIFLFEIEEADGKPGVANGKNVTARKGYENQPFFTADSSSFLFTQSQGEQTDVFEYFLDSNETKQVTDSVCLLYTSPSPRDLSTSRMPSSA